MQPYPFDIDLIACLFVFVSSRNKLGSVQSYCFQKWGDKFWATLYVQRINMYFTLTFFG